MSNIDVKGVLHYYPLGDISLDEMVIALLRIYDICNIAPSSGTGDGRSGNDIDETTFDSLSCLIGGQFSPQERTRFLTRTLPCMARYALALGELKPKNNSRFSYSISEVKETRRGIDRR